MVDAPLLRVHQLKRSVGGRTLWSNISFEVRALFCYVVFKSEQQQQQQLCIDSAKHSCSLG
jgi:ABC-type phosphonate transport system ATPase subunit